MMATPISMTKRAGNNRRARRAQKAPSLMVPRLRHSTISSEVMRKPESAKKASRKKKPPAVRYTPACTPMMPSMATPLIPSSAGR